MNNIIKKILLIAVILFFSLMPEGGIAAITIDKVVAVVNNEVITQSELEEIIQKPRKQIMEDFSGVEQERLLNKLTRDILNRMIEKKLQLQVARQMNITVSKAEVDAALDDIKVKNAFPDDETFKRALAAENMTLEQYKKELTEQLMIMRLVTKEVRSNVVISEEEIKRYYEEKKKDYTIPEEVKLRIIFFKGDNGIKKSEDVLGQIKKGADFADMAKKYSEDPTAKDGGDIGFVKKGHMLPAIENAAFSLKKGEVSNVIKADAGYYIIKIEDKKEPQYIPIEKVREEIEKSLYEQKANALYDEWLRDLRKNAHVEIKLQ
ncbi:MAG: peptidylprolyl isomerase [Nitrospirae bacterium]|nr:peptidylprolyl isomerase [Nitrospirota bacterium]